VGLTGNTRSRGLVGMFWACLALLVLLKLGPAFITVFRPPPDTHLDFVQEWLSARCYWAGDPVYLTQREAMRRQTGRDLIELDERPWNAHPPVAVLVALPFGLIPDYRTAHLVWNLVTFPMFLAGVGLIIRGLHISLHWWSIFPAIVFVVASNPVISQLWHAQLNFVLLFLIAIAWAAERRGYRAASGIAVGIATAIKLFPGLMLVYFVATRGWRQATFTVLAAISANALALGLFGWEAFATYIRVVLPSLELFRGSWGNASLTGYTTRVLLATGATEFAPVVAVTLQFGVVGTIGLVAWRATTTDTRDLAFALAIAGMPLASPIAWPYYFVLLVLPLLLLWQRLKPMWIRCVLFSVLVILLLPEGLYPGLYDRLVPESPDVTGLANHLPTPPDLGLCLVGLGFPTFALVTVFLLLTFARVDRPDVEHGPREP
jgi:hypothetical protein